MNVWLYFGTPSQGLFCHPAHSSKFHAGMNSCAFCFHYLLCLFHQTWSRRNSLVCYIISVTCSALKRKWRSVEVQSVLLKKLTSGTICRTSNIHSTLLSSFPCKFTWLRSAQHTQKHPRELCGLQCRSELLEKCSPEMWAFQMSRFIPTKMKKRSCLLLRIWHILKMKHLITYSFLTEDD